MNPLETEFIQIPKSHLKSMNSRFQGIKNLIRINVAKENELKIWKNKYQIMEARHSDMIQDFISEKMSFSTSEGTQPSYPQLPLQNSCSEPKANSISEETYLDILMQLCHATSVIRELKDNKKPLKIESWTQTEDTNSPTVISSDVMELKQNYQNLQRKMEEQQLELESSKKETENLTKQLEQESSARKLAVENEKKHKAKLQREEELHKQTKQKLQDIKVKSDMPKLNPVHVPLQRCLPSRMVPNFPNLLAVDCDEENISPILQCLKCHRSFSTNEELEYHNNNSCEKLKQNSNK